MNFYTQEHHKKKKPGKNWTPQSFFLLPGFLLLMLVIISGCSNKQQVVKKPPVITPQVEAPPPAPSNIDRWQGLIQALRSAPTHEKLQGVNQFFNKFEFLDDFTQWGVEDYWACPVETLTVNGGDCEDFSIAKYLTLEQIAIPKDQMRITYCLTLPLKRPHMVLAYFRTPGSEPLILDTKSNIIAPVSKRTDLIPVYSFNRDGYWLAKKNQNWLGERVGPSSKLSSWRDLLYRLKWNKRFSAVSN